MGDKVIVIYLAGDVLLRVTDVRPEKAMRQ